MALSKPLYPLDGEFQEEESGLMLENFNFVARQICISLVCGLCHHRFENPVVLPCLHTFCSSCLYFKRVKEHKLECVECNEELPGCVNISHLNLNFPILNILNFLDYHRGYKCDHCHTEGELVNINMQCYHLTCSDCSEFLFCSNDNNLLTMIGREIVLKDDSWCDLHPDKGKNHYCSTCDTPVCERCLVKEHILHQFDTIEDHLGKTLAGLIDDKLREIDILLSRPGESYSILESQLNIAQGKLLTYIDATRKTNENYLAEWQKKLYYLHTTTRTLIFEEMNHLLNYSQKVNYINLFYLFLMKFSCTFHKLVFKRSIENNLDNIVCKTVTKNIEIIIGKFTIDCNKILNDLKLGLIAVSRRIAMKERSYAVALTSGNSGGPQQNAGLLACFRPASRNLQVPNFSLALPSPGPSSATHSSPSLCLSPVKEDPEPEDEDPLDPSLFVVRSKLFRNPVVLSRKVIRYISKFGGQGIEDGEFLELNGITSTDTEIIVPDSNNARIQVFDLEGKFKFNFGHEMSITPNLATVNLESRDIYVCERFPSHQIKVYDKFGTFRFRFGERVLLRPRAITIDRKGRLIVVESKIKKVTIFNGVGKILNAFGCSSVEFPVSVAVNDAEEIFIADNKKHCLHVFKYNGKFVQTLGREGITDYPIAIRIDEDNNITVADNHDHLKFTVLTRSGTIVSAYTSKVKQNQCLDFTFIEKGKIAITSEDRQVYIYQYGETLEGESPAN